MSNFETIEKVINPSEDIKAGISEQEANQEGAKKERLATLFREVRSILSEIPRPSEALPQQFIIPSVLEDRENFMTGGIRSYQGGQIPVYQNGDRKLAYIDEHNWSAAVVVPADSKIDIYTDKAKNCSPLMMHLEKDGKSYILLSHILYRLPVKQIENIKEYLTQQKFNIKDILFSPRVDSRDLNEAIVAVKNIASQNTNVDIIRRERREMACTLVADTGWVLTKGLKKNRSVSSALWKM